MFKSKNSSDSENSFDSFQNSRSKHRSRSRSPQYFKPNDSYKTRSKLLKKIDFLRSQKIQLIESKKKLRDEKKELLKEIECLKSSLESYKFGTLIFLPCGHQKIVNQKHKTLLDQTFEKALDKMTQDELKNEIFLRQIRSKIFYSLECLYPEIFRCTQMQRYTNERCGHVSTAECHETKRYARQLQYPGCVIKIETVFDCGHSEFVECNQKMNAKCGKCL